MSPRSDVRAGVFVLIALAILGAASLWIAAYRPFGERRVAYEVEMKDSGGVRSGDLVRIAGVEVGRIEQVRLRPGDEWPVAIRVALGADVSLTAGSSARISRSGLLGGSYLEIVPGPAGAAPLPAGARLRGRSGESVGQTLRRLDEVADRAVVLLDQTTAVVERIGERADPLLVRLEALLSEGNVEAASVTLATLRRTVDETGPRLPGLVVQIESLAAELEAGVEGFPELRAELLALTRELRQVAGPEGERLSGVLASTEKAMEAAGGAFATVEGASGELEATLRDLRAAAASLKAFSQALAERPSRVLRNPRWPDRKPGEGVVQ